MSEMKEYTLKDCFSLRARIGWQGLRSDEFKTEGPYLVTGTDFDNGRVNWDNCYHVSVERYEQDKGIQLRENDLLVTKDGTVGKTAFVTDCPEQITLNSHIFLVRPITGRIDPAYLYYVLNSNIFDSFLNNILTGTTIKGLTQEKFYKFSFAAPDIEEQRRVVEVLRAVDEAIDETKKIVEKYRRVKDGLLHDFVKIGAGGKPELLNTEHPIVIDGWKFDDLGTLTIKIVDRDHTTPTYVANGVLIVSPKDFDEDENINFSNCKMISQKAHEINCKRTDIKAGDLIFTRIGAGLGKVCLVTKDMPEFSILHSAAMIRVSNNMCNRYLTHIIRSHYFQKQISLGIQSIGVPDLGMDKINTLKVLYPYNVNEQRHIADILDATDTKIKIEKTRQKKLLLLKKGLMQDLLISPK